MTVLNTGAVLQRERNIQRNNAVLEAMGIIVCAQQLVASHPRKARRVSVAAQPTLPCEPSRSSHRLAFKATDPQIQDQDLNKNVEHVSSSERRATALHITCLHHMQH